MSKQVNDQDDVKPASQDATPDATKTTDKAASTHPAAESSTPPTQSSSSATSPQSGNKNSRSRRRGKGSSTADAKATGTAESTADSPSDSKAKAADTASTSASASSTPKGSASNTNSSTPSAASSTSSSSPSNSTSSGSSAKPSSTSSSAAASKSSSGGTGGDAKPPSANPHGSGSGGKGSGVAIALVVILAIVLAFVAWQGWQRLENQQQRLDELAQQTEQSASQQAVSDLESRLDSGEAERDEALQNALSELRDEFDSYRSDVDETLSQVLDQLSQEQDTDEREWLHAEAAYLLRLANQRLQLEGDVEGAAALLRTADARLADADNPALTPVRSEIANELAALDAVPQVDRTGLYLALNAQQERISSLRLSQEIEEQAVTSTIEEPPTGTFQRQLARFGEELKDLVVVRHHDEALEALITPEQESYLRQSLRLVLEQTQLALLNEEKELYDASIDKALQLLNDYYDTSREETQSVITRLEELQQAEIKPELPDISGSQQELARFIENRYESRGQSGGES